MPNDLSHGGRIDASLVITSWDHTEFCEPIHLRTERVEHRRPSAQRRTDLFERQIDGRIVENTLQTRTVKPGISTVGGANSRLVIERL